MPTRGSSPVRPRGARDKAEYLALLDGLVFGEDPSEGFVRGRRFLHPKLGFTFTAPDGFTLDNTAQAVFGVKDGGAQALRLDVVRVPTEQTLAEYLDVRLDREHRSQERRGRSPSTGFPAATATATGEQWTFRLYAVRFGSEVYRFIFAAKNRTEAVDRMFRDSIDTLPPHDASPRSGRPSRSASRSVTVRPRDTVERLARRMAVADRQVERFRVLNGIGRQGPAAAGGLYKGRGGIVSRSPSAGPASKPAIPPSLQPASAGSG